jgi:hypothetical protein
MSVFVLIQVVEAEGLGGSGVVAAAFGDVQVAGVFEGRDDGGADGGQVGRPAAGAAGGAVFSETQVTDVMVRLDGPLLADQPGQVAGGGIGAGQAGDGVDGLAGSPAGRARDDCSADASWPSKSVLWASMTKVGTTGSPRPQAIGDDRRLAANCSSAVSGCRAKSVVMPAPARPSSVSMTMSSWCGCASAPTLTNHSGPVGPSLPSPVVSAHCCAGAG